MRVIALRQRVEENLEHIVTLHLTDISKGLVVAANDGFFRRAELEFIQVFLKKFGFDSRCPYFIGFRKVFRPWGLLAVQLYIFVPFEIVIFLRQLFVALDAALDAHFEASEDLVRRFHISPQNRLVQRGGVFIGEFLHVFLCEVEFVVVQLLEIGIKQLGRHFFVEGLAGVVGLLKPICNGESHLTLIGRV